MSRDEDAPRHRRPIKLTELTDATFVDFPIGWGIRTVVDRAFTELGLHRRVGIEVADTSMCVQLVREGVGVALLSQSLVAQDPSGLHAHPVTPAPTWDLAVITRPAELVSPAAGAFIELLEL